MGKIRVLIVLIAVFVVAYAAGRVWKVRSHSEAGMVVHKGAIAMLAGEAGDPVWVSFDRKDAYPLQAAMTRKDNAFLNGAVQQRIAFRVDAGTRVRVREEAVDKRLIEILDGPQAGRTGWVQFELLRVPKPGEL